MTQTPSTAHCACGALATQEETNGAPVCDDCMEEVACDECGNFIVNTKLIHGQYLCDDCWMNWCVVCKSSMCDGH